MTENQATVMQQIDFYLDEFKPQREPLMAHHLAMALAVVVVLLTVFSVFKGASLTTLADTEEQLSSQNNNLTSQVETLRAQIPESRQQELDAELNGLKIQLYRRQQIRQLINRLNLGNAQGFSEQMHAMARQYLPELSLDAFSLSNGGGYLEFSGWSSEASHIPLYLQRLRSEESFERTKFGVLNVERSEQRAKPLYFSVTSPEREKAEDGRPKLQASALSQLQATNELRPQ